VGDVYQSETTILRDLDPGEDVPDRKPERPVVVVRAPTRTYPKVHVVVRTSLQRGAPIPEGVPHPSDAGLRLDLPGVWLPRVKWATPERFAAPHVEYLGVLDPQYLEKVLQMVRRG
jgi:hypothetical protein